MRVLRGGVQRGFIRRTAIVADRDTRLHRVGDKTLVYQFQRRDMGCFPDRLVDRLAVLFDKAPVIAKVAFQIVVNLGRAPGQRRLHVHDGGQFVDIHHDGLGGIAGLFGSVGHDGGNRVAHVAHLALGQHRVRRFLHRFAETVSHQPATGQPADAFEILPGKDAHHARHLFCRGSVDTVDPPMRHVRAQEMDIGLPVNVDVVGVVSCSGQEPQVFAPLGAGADTMIFRHIRSPPWDRYTRVNSPCLVVPFSSCPYRRDRVRALLRPVGIIPLRWRLRPGPMRP